ncbi:MAG: hypothetical protein ACK52I_24650 [Pseudomonadota bacterium]
MFRTRNSIPSSPQRRHLASCASAVDRGGARVVARRSKSAARTARARGSAHRPPHLRTVRSRDRHAPATRVRKRVQVADRQESVIVP